MGKHEQFPECEGMEYYFAEDGRLVAIVVRSDFEGYGLFPPFLDTEEERAFVQTAYDINLERERDTKAHVTPEDFPLQITLLNRELLFPEDPKPFEVSPVTRCEGTTSVFLTDYAGKRLFLFNERVHDQSGKYQLSLLHRRSTDSKYEKTALVAGDAKIDDFKALKVGDFLYILYRRQDRLTLLSLSLAEM